MQKMNACHPPIIQLCLSFQVALKYAELFKRKDEENYSNDFFLRKIHLGQCELGLT